MIVNNVTANEESEKWSDFKTLAIIFIGDVFTKNEVELSGNQKNIFPD